MSEKPTPTRLGELNPTEHKYIGVRDELRRNLLRKLRASEALFPGIVGYENTVVPQVVNAILARHDLILLGLRGQAKTRLCRMLRTLLDPWMPVIPCCPLRSHPFRPITATAQDAIDQHGPDLEIEWLPPTARYHEKLATPDVSMGDLIGDIDPLKAAHDGLDLSDERVIHYGIVPRANRGIFTINELPDLAPRIQVGLLNILEEQDVQIRGFPIRIELDLLLVFTANPEDYTNRGSIITPLKDRIASQIVTHYPRDLAEARTITEAEAWLHRPDADAVQVPEFIADLVEGIAFEGRDSEYVDQTSGVSARLAIAARELLISQVEQRAAAMPESTSAARLVDVGQLLPAITGKVELVYEGEQEGASQVARRLIGNATQRVFDQMFPDVIREGSDPDSQADRYKPILDWFAGANTLELSDRMEDDEYRAALDSVPGLGELVDECLPSAPLLERAAAMELILDGLHLHSLLAKQDLETGASYSDMLGVMMDGLR